MSEAKHAPGPWVVAEWEARDKDGAVEADGWQVVGADGYGISTCIDSGEGGQEEANLHFIVRACNAHDPLIKVLRRIIERVRDSEGGDMATLCFALEQVQCDARAALSATGAA